MILKECESFTCDLPIEHDGQTKKRRVTMEATYNARALHQVNLMFLAQPLYEKCLEIKDEWAKANKEFAKNADLRAKRRTT